mmetsp:Transcript_36742/g.113304  ORF Transcript_36742/g.113304 Transcript_36742/m.113304 type:complete len:203 (+) Transcript_36742:1228-1836(+)
MFGMATTSRVTRRGAQSVSFSKRVHNIPSGHCHPLANRSLTTTLQQRARRPTTSTRGRSGGTPRQNGATVPDCEAPMKRTNVGGKVAHGSSATRMRRRLRWLCFTTATRGKLANRRRMARRQPASSTGAFLEETRSGLSSTTSTGASIALRRTGLVVRPVSRTTSSLAIARSFKSSTRRGHFRRQKVTRRTRSGKERRISFT